LSKGESVAEVLPAEHRSLALRVARRTGAGAERLLGWTRRIEQLQQGPYVPAMGRFSNPPRIDDLAALSLDDDDLGDLRRCRPGDCGVKLSDVEIANVRQTIDAARSDWKPAAQQAFRGIVLARLERYLAEGHGLSAVYDDERKRVYLDAEFAAVASAVAVTQPQLFPLTNYLSLYPKGEQAGVESFFYWSKELLGPKPIVGITHVAMMQNPLAEVPEALVARKQVYASHYITGALSFTAIGAAPGGTERYLVYLNHSRADMLDGVFGGIIRRIVERRLKAEGPRALDVMRRRLESGEP